LPWLAVKEKGILVAFDKRIEYLAGAGHSGNLPDMDSSAI